MDEVIATCFTAIPYEHITFTDTASAATLSPEPPDLEPLSKPESALHIRGVQAAVEDFLLRYRSIDVFFGY
ncbi:hypothetical protein FJU08_20675 [Martelella alba]|uniref:Uncharacterized protein n=1 Tax=Martelella alba TaxID=2590451 RepID=A0A506U138_9HYPH|nr:hypothetical protein [Martelella alba]TPW27208.1 hypothetical protein FJU08_20675 [Martelella alba]